MQQFSAHAALRAFLVPKLALCLMFWACTWNVARAQFNYAFTAVSGTYVQVSASGSDLNSIESDDVHSASIPLGFAFGYAGSSITTVKVNSNGWISMDDVNDSPSASQGRDNSSFSSANSNVRPGIFPLWDDLDGASTGIARYETTGSIGSRVFTMEWRNWEWNFQTNAATISFECKLYEGSNIIEFIYRPESAGVNSASGGASIGLMSTNSGTYYSLNGTGTGPSASTSSATVNLTAKPASGQIYRFTPTGCTAPVISSTTNTGPVCSTSTLGLNTATSAGTAPFSYVWTGTGTFSDATDINPTVTGAATGTYSVVVKNWCGASANGNTSAVVSAQPTTSNAGPDQTICITTPSVSLAANTPSAGTGVWTVLAGSPSTAVGQLSSTSSATATFTPAGGAGTYNLRWTISNSPCTASTNDVAIIVNAPPATANAGGDLTICATGNIGLSANSANPGTGAWAALPGSPSTASGQFSSTSSPTATFTPAGGAGVYTLRWTTSRAPCASTQDDVVITANPTPTASNAGPDQTICVTTPSVALAANAPSTGTGAWTILAGSPSTALAQLSSTASPTATFTHAGGAGTYTLRWTISNSPCTASTNDVAIIVNPTPTVANAGADQTICTSPGSTTLSGNAASAGTDSWSFISGPVTPTITSSGSPSTTVTGMTTAGTYVFQWNITNAPCTASADQVSILVNQTPSASASSNTPVCEASPLNLTGTTNIGSAFSWTGPGGYSSSSQNPTIASAALANSGSYSFTATHNGCASATANTTVVVNVRPTVPVVTPPSASVCLGSGVGLSASATTPPVTFAGGAITITDIFFLTAASPYPSAISVGGLPATGVTVASVSLLGTSHAEPVDLDILLQSPAGTNVVLMSDVGGSATISGNNYVIQDGAAAFAAGSTNPSGTYAPTNSGATDNYTSPGPGSITQAAPSIANFSGNANGTWNLYVVDDQGNLVGGSFSGWSITFNVPVSYSWAPPAGLNITNGAVVTATPLSTTTYTVTATNGYSCTRSTNAVITVVPPPNAGTAGVLSICSNAAPVSLFAQLGGTPDINGTWSGPSTVTGGMYDPVAMNAGTYVYSVTAAPCAPAFANVVVTEIPATQWFADADNDGAGDPNSSLFACSQPPGYVSNDDDLCLGGPEPGTPCNDNNVCTTGDMIGTNCQCAGTFQDADNDGTCDANDLCPSGPEPGTPCNDNNVCTTGDVIGTNCQCAGTFQDADNDGTCDANDLCPSGPEPGTPCDDNNVCTAGDVIGTNCQCAGTFQDTDNDGTCDANDLCPGGPEPNHSCNDGDPCTINDKVSANCGCAGVPAGDSDNDGVCDPLDQCPGAPEPGMGCDDGNPFTVNDLMSGSCVCAGTAVPCTENVVLDLHTDGAGAQTSWEIKDDTSPFIVCSGDNYSSNAFITVSCCLVPGCYVLNVFDSFGDGMTTGGYVLRTAGGDRIIDNANDGSFGYLSSSPLGFCVPMGQDKLTVYTCDREDLNANSVIVASPNAGVVAQFGTGNQADDGYQFWLYDPDGTYSRRIFKSHAAPGAGGAPGANACAHLKLSSIITAPVPADVLLNVRLRGMVNGMYAEFGPACRMKMLSTPNTCPSTQLDNNPLHAGTTLSCGATGKVVGGSGNASKLWPNLVAGANKYQYEFSMLSEGYLRTIAPATGQYTLVLSNWMTNPLLCGTNTYDVRVRVSFNGGTSWCPWGPSCEVEITNTPPSPCTGFGAFNGGGGQNSVEAERIQVAMWPNPVHDGRVQLELNGLATDATEVTIDVFDLYGKRVLAKTIATGGAEELNTLLTFDRDIARGLYMVNIANGNTLHVQRLVIE